MKILGFGTYDVRSHPRVKVLLEGLAARHDVRELNRPLGIGTAGRVSALTSPAAGACFAACLLGKWASLATGSRVFRGEAKPDAVLVGYLGHFDVLLARALYPRTTIILDHLIFAGDTAADRGLVGTGMAGRLKQKALGALDEAAIRAADIVIVDTSEHAGLVPPSQRSKARVVPVGAPGAWFAAEPGVVGNINNEPAAPLSVVFFGLFTPLQGAPTIARALAILEERGVNARVTLIGSGQDAEEVRSLLPSGKHVSIEWLEWVEAEELPALVASHDVCLGIFGTSPKARRVVPNKAYQALAAGCALVTSDTPPQRAMLGDAAIYVEPGDPEALADALESLGNPARLSDARRAAASSRELWRPEAVTRELGEEL